MYNTDAFTYPALTDIVKGHTVTFNSDLPKSGSLDLFEFNGLDDYVEYLSNSDVDFSVDNFTVETWVRVDHVGYADHMIWETRSAASSTEDGLVFFVDGSNRTWKVWTAGAAKIIGNIDDVAADTWYHTVVARSSGTTTLYVNGVSIGTFSDSYNYSNDDLRIGKNISSDNYLKGKIAQFRLYKGTGFTSAEVNQNFYAHKRRFGY